MNRIDSSINDTVIHVKSTFCYWFLLPAALHTTHPPQVCFTSQTDRPPRPEP